MRTLPLARMIIPTLILLASGLAVRAAGAQATAPATPPPPSSVPSSGTAPAGATAKCKDGTFSKSKKHSGTCSRHRGVDQWLDGSK